MSAYPTLPIGLNSRRVLRDGRQEDAGADGVVRVRKLHADKYDFEIIHPALNASQLATLQVFYTDNATAASIDLLWPEDGLTYAVRFGRNAIERKWAAPGLRDVIVRLVGV